MAKAKKKKTVKPKTERPAFSMPDPNGNRINEDQVRLVTDRVRFGTSEWSIDMMISDAGHLEVTCRPHGQLIIEPHSTNQVRLMTSVDQMAREYRGAKKLFECWKSNEEFSFENGYAKPKKGKKRNAAD